jgi:urea transporter
MMNIRFYHIRTLFWTYISWAVLMLFFAFMFCNIANYPLTWMPYYWALLNIAPLWILIGSCWYGGWADTFIIISAAITVVAGLSVVAGLLINRRWACFLVIIGMSIWFFEAFCILGMGV